MDIFGARNTFGCLRADGAVIDQGAIVDRVGPVVDGDVGIYEVAIGIIMAYAQLGDLGAAAHVGLLVAVNATAGIVCGSDTLRNIFLFHKGVHVGGKGCSTKAVAHCSSFSVVKWSGKGRWCVCSCLCNAEYGDQRHSSNAQKEWEFPTRHFIGVPPKFPSHT